MKLNSTLKDAWLSPAGLVANAQIELPDIGCLTQHSSNVYEAQRHGSEGCLGFV